MVPPYDERLFSHKKSYFSKVNIAMLFYGGKGEQNILAYEEYDANIEYFVLKKTFRKQAHKILRVAQDQW